MLKNIHLYIRESWFIYCLGGAGDERVTNTATTAGPVTRRLDTRRWEKKNKNRNEERMITNRWGGGWWWGCVNEITKAKGGVRKHQYLLTSLNLSHLPASHLSSKKLPLSERAETRPRATAHTHSKTTLSICGHTTTTTTTTRRGERTTDEPGGWTRHSRKALPTQAAQSASATASINSGCKDAQAPLLPTLSHQLQPGLYALAAAVLCH